jgi:hypothetical protein
MITLGRKAPPAPVRATSIGIPRGRSDFTGLNEAELSTAADSEIRLTKAIAPASTA